MLCVFCFIWCVGIFPAQSFSRRLVTESKRRQVVWNLWDWKVTVLSCVLQSNVTPPLPQVLQQLESAIALCRVSTSREKLTQLLLKVCHNCKQPVHTCCLHAFYISNELHIPYNRNFLHEEVQHMYYYTLNRGGPWDLAIILSNGGQTGSNGNTIIYCQEEFEQA